MEILPPRIVGSETEFAYRFKLYNNRVDILNDSVGQALIDGLPDDVIGYRPRRLSRRIDRFLENGARYYMDINGILEYATPECLSFADVINYEIAGEEYIASHMGSDSVGSVMKEAVVFKRASDHHQQENTLGSHENYFSADLSVSRDFVHGKTAYELASHLITRSIFTGAGSTDYEGNFHKTQKLRNLTKDISQITTGEKPIVNTRNEPLSATGSRIHVISGDPNISAWASWMKFGTTSLTLRLIENGCFPDEALLSVNDIVLFANAIGSTASLDTIVLTQKGEQVTALDIQDRIYEQCVKLGENIELPQEEYAIIDQWGEVLQDLRTDPDKCLDRIDWLQNMYSINKTSDKYLRHKRDLGYTMIYPCMGFGVKLRRGDQTRLAPTRQQLADVKINAPKDTRASVRGEAVKTLTFTGKSAMINWDNIKVFMRNDTHLDFAMNDPYDNDIERFHSWLGLLT